MHQSGQERAHSMHTVQFSSLSAMTPRARGAGSSRSCGYCTVTAGRVMVRNVTPSPVSMPLIFFILFPPAHSRERPAAGGDGSAAHPLERDLQDTSDEDVHERDRDQPLPRQRLELVLT